MIQHQTTPCNSIIQSHTISEHAIAHISCHHTTTRHPTPYHTHTSGSTKRKMNPTTLPPCPCGSTNPPSSLPGVDPNSKRARWCSSAAIMVFSTRPAACITDTGRPRERDPPRVWWAGKRRRNGMEWDNMGLNGTGWDEMGRDGMRWDAAER